MAAGRQRLRRAALVFLGLGILPAPWFFGAWERWWFWPFAFCLFASGFCLALHGLARVRRGETLLDDAPTPGQLSRLRPVLLAALPFLAYAALRVALTPVYLDAERSFLLFATPLLAGGIAAFGLTKDEQRLLLLLIVIDLALLGLYGAANHALTGSRSVLWAPQYAQYTGRAGGSYHCPDHFAGVMELAFALGLAYTLSRACGLGLRLAGAALAALAAGGVVLSQSRGGGLTLLVVVGAAFVWGFDQWPPEVRVWNRLSLAVAPLIVALLLLQGNSAYGRRFRDMLPGAGTTCASLVESALDSPRGRMIPAAYRSWRTAPLFGIGAGMHRNVWPAIAATPDGNREAGIPPSQWNDTFHSYEVHSDWLQLLQEYGGAGFVLFLLPVAVLLRLLLAALARERLWWRRGLVRTRSTRDQAVVLGGLFCGTAMAFHSLGDFNLQIPATTWLLGTILGLATAAAARQEAPPSRARS